MNRQLAIGIIAGRTKDVETTKRMLQMATSDKHAGVRAYILSNFGGSGGLSLHGLEEAYVATTLHALRDDPIVAKEAIKLVTGVTGPVGRQLAQDRIRDYPEDTAKVHAVLKAWDSNAIRDRVWRLTKSGDRQMRWDAMLASAALRDKRSFDSLLAGKRKDLGKERNSWRQSGGQGILVPKRIYQKCFPP